MGVILPALSLAIVHIAGDNVAVVPAMASLIGKGIYPTVFLAYMIFGSAVAGVSAWIGVKSGRELTTVVKRLFGSRGKLLLAVVVLAVSLPASALTGGYFAGHLLQNLAGIPYSWSVPVCVFLCCALSAGYGQEFLRISNYLALLLIPATGIMAVMLFSTVPVFELDNLFSLQPISWPLVLALIGYNAGGMRSALVVEAGTYLSNKNCAGVYLVILAKCFEGLFTLFLAHIVLITGAYGFMPLSMVANRMFCSWLAAGFNSVLLCILVNTMVPAMLVNAKQLSIVTKSNFKSALLLAGLLVWCGSFIHLEFLLMIMSATGLFMIFFIGCVAYFLHKQEDNQSQ
ncbi:hypothetical protein [Sporomusa acidovorans]|uniref:Uncharacterized protein n=1 Tax=Sporomusa acidovorans (strain ATCC 49682 / DSM 3132 / Mol) TaxID=1123286 RepID=A0ABZ3J476_SPOA4|nr:hypothetical protein [Sporomusa acidovorans]OZC20883.1 hypothetical protein SPACI_22460 [Sporomusa acidovorans DSM 3132]SDE60037.1 hypothetical protein SAMN04488499_101731 [Sporomusa acidovorans]